MMRLVVRDHHPRRRAWIFLASGIAALFAGWGMFEFGRYQSGLNCRIADDVIGELREKNKKLEIAVEGLEQERITLERNQQIERESHKQLETTVAGLQDETSKLKSELAFYRGVIAPKDAKSDLRIQNLSVIANGLTRGYRYKLVLTRIPKRDAVASGRVGLTIEGKNAGKYAVFDLSQLAPDGGRELVYKFKYFQTLEGDLQLPEDFAPSRITVKVNPSDKRNQPMENVFEWPV